jgi:hypothetical protein
MDVTSKEEEDLELNVLLLMSGEPAAVGLEEQLQDEMKSNEMTDEVLKSYSEKIGIKAVRDWKKNVEKFLKWLDVAPQRCPYVNFTKAKLVEECVGKFGGGKELLQV